MGQSRPLFVYFRHFLGTILIIQIEKSVDGVLGIRTRGRKMVGADETTELWHRISSLRRNFLQKMALDDSSFFSCMEILAALNRNSLIPKWYWQQVYIVSR